MVMEVTPSPQCVGREFVRQYYTLLNQAPTHVHRFYNNNSSFVHGGLDTFNQEGKPAIGQKQIHQCIQQLNFRDCHAKITQVDSQATLGNGVVVQVTGELSNGGQPMRRFTQTFVLGSQSPKQYYVHNDIFRYQDMVFSDDDTDKDSGRYEAEEEVEQDHTPPVECAPNHVANEQSLGGYYVTGSMPTVNGAPHQEELPAPPSVTPAVQQPVPQPQILQVQQQQPAAPYGIDIMQQSQQQQLVPQGVQSGYQSEECEAEPEEEEEEEETPEDVQEEVKGDECYIPDIEQHQQDNSTSNEPKTYAATLVKSGGGISNFNTSPSAPVKSPVSPPLVSRLTPQESRNNETNISNNRTGPRPQRGGSNIRGIGSRPGSDRPPSSRNNMSEENGGRDDIVPYGADGDRRRQGGSSGGGGNSQQYSDNHQLFMGNLPLSATEDDLRSLFSKFGTIVDLRILSKSGGMKGGTTNSKVPNYGFIIFDSVTTVQSVLQARPIYYPDEGGNIKLNVEEKKTKPRNSTDGGRIGSGGDVRGARSSSMLGRGGGMAHRGGSRGGFMRGGADGVRGAMRPGSGPGFNQRGQR